MPCLLSLALFLSACARATSPSPVTIVAPVATQPQVATATDRPTEAPTAMPDPTDTPAPTPAHTATPLPTEPPAASPTPVLLPPPPASNAYALRRIVGGLGRPVDLKHAGDGSGRLFVVEQPGRIRILQDGALLSEPFLDIRDLVNDRGNEQGLLGLAFSPQYPSDGRFYVNYTGANGATVVARYSVSGDPNRADPASAQVILQVAQPFANHNGGNLVFGPDGYLYIGLGDGGSAGDPQGNAQRLDTLLGKMLRLDVSQGDPYSVPPDNPFVGEAGARPEIWAYGLRNPWRYSFDRATGDLYLGDVGQNAYEEINFQPADSRGGENYGWNFMEGAHPYRGQPPDGLVLPIAEYSRDGGCSVTGGYVYRGALLPELNGVYLFGDYCTGFVWALYRTASGAWQSVKLLDAFFTLSSFGEDEAGELYLLDHGGGAVHQLVAAP
jgi:glucose/arabinose dehydrogenase